MRLGSPAAGAGKTVGLRASAPPLNFTVRSPLMTLAPSSNSVRPLRRIGLAAVVCATLASAAANPPSDAVSERPCPATAARMVLWHSGKVTLNGAEAPIEKLGSAVAALAPRPTEVCYTQENPHDELRDLGRLLGELIVLRIPLSIYSDTSFLRRMSAHPARTRDDHARVP